MAPHVHGGGCCGGHHHSPDPKIATPVDTSPPHSAGSEIDVSGDGGVVKKVLEAGTGERPPSGNEVTVHYVGTLEDGSEFDSSRKREAPFKFTLGAGEVIRGWDVGVASMSVGEKSLLTIKPNYGYGEAGAGSAIPANATLQFEVELLSFRAKPKPRSAMTAEERIQAAADEKEKGNAAFRLKNFPEAIANYREGLAYLEYTDHWSDEQKELKMPVEVSLRLNLSNCYLKTDKQAQAIEEASLALKLDPENIKAFYRRAVARAAFGLLEEARADFTSAARLDPRNAEIRNELKRCKEKLEHVRAQEKNRFGSMFSKVALYEEKAGVWSLASCPKVFLEVQVGDDSPKRLVVALYADTLPKTAENFRHLCIGDRVGKSGRPLTLKGSAFHRITPECMMGGDIDGEGGESIYGRFFEDESFAEKASERGKLVMLNSGSPDTNSSRFAILFKPTPSFNGKNSVFGEVVEGLNFLEEFEAVVCNEKEEPQKPVVIVDCGVC